MYGILDGRKGDPIRGNESERAALVFETGQEVGREALGCTSRRNRRWLNPFRRSR
jgi:hypothetical protein